MTDTMNPLNIPWKLCFDRDGTEARAAQDWPDQEKTRQRAYRMYEDELAAARSQPSLALPADPAYPPTS